MQLRELPIETIAAALVLPFITFCSTVSLAQTVQPTAVWIDIEDSNDGQDTLFQAVHAQISGTPVDLARIKMDRVSMTTERRAETLGQIAAQLNASLVFWVEDGDECHTYYYLSNASPPKTIQRTLELEQDTVSSRQEFIAIAMAGMVERLHITKKIEPRPAVPPKEEETPKPPEPVTQTPQSLSSLGEFRLAYEGMMLNRDFFANGVRLGVWLFPAKHLGAGVSYTQFFPASYSTNDVELTLLSRIITLSAAGVFRGDNADFRLGAAWMVDIRSFTTSLRSGILQNSIDGRKTVHAVAPFISAGYFFTPRIRIFAQFIAPIALNDTTYSVTFDDVSYPLQKPFPVKLNFLAGLSIKL